MTDDEHMQVCAQQNAGRHANSLGIVLAATRAVHPTATNVCLWPAVYKPRPTYRPCCTLRQMVSMRTYSRESLTSDTRQVPELVSEPSLTDHDYDSDSGLGGMPPLRRARLSQPLAPPSPTPATHVRHL